MSNLIIKYYYFIDKLYFEAFLLFNKHETSVTMQDRMVPIMLTQERLLLLQFFFAIVAVSKNQRRNVMEILNIRLTDICLTWIKESFDVPAVAVRTLSPALLYRDARTGTRSWIRVILH